jgi:hypothetical protein
MEEGGRSSLRLFSSYKSNRAMERSGKLRRSAVVSLTITASLTAASCCDRGTSPTERAGHSAWWRFWHNESWCGSGYSHGGGYGYYGSGSGRATSGSATSRGGFGGAAHGFGGG